MSMQRAPSASLKKLKVRYCRDGYVYPVRVMPAEEMTPIRHRLESYLAQSDRNPKEDPFLQFKVHMVFPWADALIRHPAVLDAVEALIGPDILVWNTAVLAKKPQNADFVSWHQDIYYWGNHPDHVVGAWIAIADSTPENGCVQVIPRSHKEGVRRHDDTFGADNMLSRGQKIVDAVDEGSAVDMALRAGEMSLHHTMTVHGSRSNRSGSVRMGFVITYMHPATKMIGPRTGATLVRGVDSHGHFDPEAARPAADLDPIGIAAHDAAMLAFSAAIYTDASNKVRLVPEKSADGSGAARQAPR
jgi:chlorinating enzyme